MSVPEPMYTYAQSLDDALLRSHLAFRIRIGQKETVVGPGDNYLVTWYRATILDNLTGSELPRLFVPPIAHTPPSFGPLPDDGLLVRTFGGRTQIEGVTVWSPEVPAGLDVGKEYVVFGRFVDYESGEVTRVFDMSLGARGLFIGDGQLDTFTPAHPDPSDQFINDVLAQAKRSLSGLRDVLLKSQRRR